MDEKASKGHSGPRKRRPKNKNKKKLEDGLIASPSVQSPPKTNEPCLATPVKTITTTKLCAEATPFSPTMKSSSSPNRSLEAATRAYWTQWAINAAEQERARRLRLLAEIQQDEDMERLRRQQWAREVIEAEQHSRTTRMFLDAMQNTAWFQATISPSFLDYEVVCPHSWFGCTYSCMLRHLEEHLLDCPYRQVPDTPTIEYMDLNSYDLVCPNAILGCKTICSRDTLAEHLSVCGIRTRETEWEERMQSQQSAIEASETERLRRINELNDLNSTASLSEVHKLYDAQTKALHSRLHAEIVAFGAAHATSAKLRRPMVLHVIQVITSVVQSTWPTASVEPYGSFVKQLNLPSSDVDLVVGPFHCDRVDDTNAIADVQQLGNLLKSASKPDVAFTSIQIFARASIPLLKVIVVVGDEVSVALDITCWTPKHQGLASAALGLQLCQDISGLSELTLVLKYYLAKRGLNDAYRGGLSSYGLLLMVAHALLRGQECHSEESQISACPPDVEPNGNLAAIQRAKGEKIAVELTADVKRNDSGDLFLGKLLMDVLHYYGNNFQPEVDAVTLKFPHLNSPPSDVGASFFIQDPLDDSNNVGRHCYRISHILRGFQDVSNYLTALIVRGASGDKDGSLLDRIFESQD
ncbi:hypothetical protein LEN26_014296 [Aphanomyces euteiches]|nr:hypothetical protein LEN26_014296 [Aphanomyces euteiches]KAH9112438.1 hypothetical protein AeMF1_013236 [Aphanomyces euteiches]KAH9191180.1 hypothetical protein AeNC1_006835 [Aphanomyces euteiches]